MISPLILALFAALAFSLNNFFSRLGLEESTPLTAVTVSVTVNALGLWVLAAFVSPIRPIFSVNVWPFVLAGIFAPSLARSLLFYGYQDLGLARSDVIAGSMPLFAVLMAVVFIGERPSMGVVFGTVSVVLGVGLLIYKPDGNKPWVRWTMLFPIGAAFFFALRDVTIKVGLQLFPHPVAAAALTVTVSGLIMNFPYLFPRRRKQVVLTKKSFLLFCLSGILTSAAYFCIFVALQGGTVSQVNPLLSVFPLFSVLLSFLFLQSKERVTLRVVGGGIIVVAGASFIFLS